jgi:16S rRNA (cytosine1402-N4)-methyltransferase
MPHTPVLLKEVLEQLDPQKGDVVLDGTVGNAGHSVEICKQIGKSGVLIGLDQDANSLKVAGSNLKEAKCKVFLVEENFRNLDKALESFQPKAGRPRAEKINKILLDLGVNSDQIDNSGRGFTFLKDEPLLMTMKAEVGRGDLTAREIVNKWREDELADIIYKYGEERFSRSIARNIVRKRPIETTFELVEIIRLSVPPNYRNNKRLHCATRTFQALRIAVNDELGALVDGLNKSWQVLEKGGRLVVISFHSLEDRIVKNYFKDLSATGEGKILTKKPVIPTEAEERENPRSRSAKLRAIEKGAIEK